jgi:hypothetical protein
LLEDLAPGLYSKMVMKEARPDQFYLWNFQCSLTQKPKGEEGEEEK